MSVHATSWVFRHSPERHSARLVLLVLADKADGEGRNAFPSIATIADEARLSKSAVKEALLTLKAHGSIVAEGRSEFRTTSYRVVMDLAQIDTSAIGQDLARPESGHSQDVAPNELPEPPIPNEKGSKDGSDGLGPESGRGPESGHFPIPADPSGDELRRWVSLSMPDLLGVHFRRAVMTAGVLRAKDRTAEITPEAVREAMGAGEVAA